MVEPRLDVTLECALLPGLDVAIGGASLSAQWQHQGLGELRMVLEFDADGLWRIGEAVVGHRDDQRVAACDLIEEPRECCIDLAELVLQLLARAAETVRGPTGGA